MKKQLLLTLCSAIFICSFAQTGNVKWSIGAVGPGTFTDNPQYATIGPDGTIYVNTEQSYLVALNSSDGAELWDLSGHYFPPSIGADGTLYSGNSTDMVAINPDGSERWRVPLGIDISTSPALAEDGTVYAAADQYLIAVDPVAQTELWRLAMGAGIVNAPSVGYDGSVYVTSGSDLVAINPETQTELWRFTADDPITSSAALGAEGMIYVGANSQLYAFNPDGTQRWKFKTGAWIGAASAIGSDGTIYTPVSFIASGYSGYGSLIALHPDGYQKWRLRTDYYNRSTPTLGANGNIYLATAGFEGLLAIDPYGNEIWRIPAFGNANWSPPMAPDGTIYFSATLGTFTAVETTSGGLADTPWPMDSHDAQHTGRNNDFTPACPGPVITAEPENLLIEPDSTATLTITVNGEPPLDYQWYEGFTGDKSNPVVGSGGSFTTPALSESKQYWVEVSNTCGFTFSRAVTVAVGSDGQVKWYFEANEEVLTSAAIADDGTVYFGTQTATLYAVNPDGIEKWQFQAYIPPPDDVWDFENFMVNSHPTIGPDGTIYVGTGMYYYASGDEQTNVGCLWAINPDGSEKWWHITAVTTEYWSEINSSPALGLDGTLYFTDYRAHLYAVNGDGSRKWRFEASLGQPYPASWSSSTIGRDGTIYYCSNWLDSPTFYTALYAVNPDGTEQWHYQMDNSTGSFGSPAIGLDGSLYLPGSEGYFLALNPDGTEKWQFNAGDRCSNAAIGVDGTVYLRAGQHAYALNPVTGAQVWQSGSLPSDGFHDGLAPAVGADGMIYVRPGALYALNPADGSTRWVVSPGPGSFSSPVIAPDGTLYAGRGKGTTSSMGYLWAYTTGSMGPADSQWPVSGQNIAHWQRDPNATLICEEPVITSQPQDQTIVSGENATITITATGTALLYQWYQGIPGDMGTPADTDAILITPALTQNTNYWVQVSNACGTENSQKAMVTVIPGSISQINADAMAVRIVPNPAASVISLQSAVFSLQSSVVELFDLKGRKLLEKYTPSGTETVEIDVSGLKSGVYFCKISTEKYSLTKKLMIQK